MTGVIAWLSRHLADAGVPIFVLSTYDTDVVLVPEARAAHAADAWRAAGIAVDA